jgi:hypothetical protein
VSEVRRTPVGWGNVERVLANSVVVPMPAPHDAQTQVYDGVEGSMMNVEGDVRDAVDEELWGLL